MPFKDESVLVGELTTVGRRTGLPRTVELRLVYANGRFYATTSKVETKHWCQNMIKNPTVKIRAGKQSYSCIAQRVTDDNLRERILRLRDSSILMDRVVFEITPSK